MTIFRRLLWNSLVSGVMSYFLWFALTFWVYIETKSVVATSVIGGAFAVISAVFGMLFGTFVDRHRKHTSMVVAGVGTLVASALATVEYALIGRDDLLALDRPWFWLFVALLLAGSVFNNLRSIALATTVSLLVEETRRDKANGMIGTALGISLSLTSVLSGLVVGRLGMGWALVIALVLMSATLGHLLTIRVPEDAPERSSEHGSEKAFDFHGATTAIRAVPGLYGLIGFAALNNLLGGVFMSLLDAYGLSLVSVEVWGLMFAVISLGFIAGGVYVARRGLGSDPLRIILLINLCSWAVTALFTLRSSVWMLGIGMLVWMSLMPIVEAAEQTVLQRVVPFDHQGRVFGFAQTIENAASPLTALVVGPLAQYVFIPEMEAGGRGADLIGDWFGVGGERGLALLFTLAGLIGMVATIGARTTRWYRRLGVSAAAPGPTPAV